jgi:hypothetical protein
VEIDHLVDAVKVVTLENIIRFLSAHLDPKSQMPTDYKNQNLDRAKNQVKLLMDIEDNQKQMKEIIFAEFKRLNS